MIVRMFKPRFAPLVEAGTKLQTVRPRPKRLRDMPKEGDAISLRTWTGLPYRSKQRNLRESLVASVELVLITREGVTTGGPDRRIEPQCDEFARADGFESWAELIAWFEEQHGLPFLGILIKWQPKPTDS
jgi:hypothetical protein